MEPQRRFTMDTFASQDHPTRQVLLVEDEAVTLRLYHTGLKGLMASGWRLRTVANGAEALEVLKAEPMDVVVTDLNMPIMDGYSLISHIYKRYPTLPILVITSVPLAEAQDRVLQLGALRVMSKPVRLSLLMDEIRRAGEIRPEGLVRGLPLGSLLQLMQWEGRTATVQVRSGTFLGHLYLYRGSLVHAETATREGLHAAYEILLWESPEATFTEACRIEVATIELPVPEILMNVALLQDNAHMPAAQPGAPGQAAPEPGASEPAPPEPPSPPPVRDDLWGMWEDRNA